LDAHVSSKRSRNPLQSFIGSAPQPELSLIFLRRVDDEFYLEAIGVFEIAGVVIWPASVRMAVGEESSVHPWLGASAMSS
jgi:hypothetical protein